MSLSRKLLTAIIFRSARSKITRIAWRSCSLTTRWWTKTSRTLLKSHNGTCPIKQRRPAPRQYPLMRQNSLQTPSLNTRQTITHTQQNISLTALTTPLKPTLTTKTRSPLLDLCCHTAPKLIRHRYIKQAPNNKTFCLTLLPPHKTSPLS